MQRKTPFWYIHLYWQILFYLAPLCVLIVVSLSTMAHYRLNLDPTFQNYKLILASSVYRQVVLNSIGLAGFAALVATAIAIPLAHILYRVRNLTLRRFALMALMSSLVLDYTVKMFGWQLWLQDNGILAYVLRQCGVITDGLGLIYTPMATEIGLLSLLLPISGLIIYLSLSRVDPLLEQAAKNLGARPWQIRMRVIYPMCVPGIGVAFLLTFVFAFGDIVSARVLGGGKVYTIGLLIADRVSVQDWPGAASLGVLALVISLAAIVGVLVLVARVGTAAAIGREA